MHSNSQAGRDFMWAGQPIKRRPGGAQQLTRWKGFHGGTSANQTEARRCTATHRLEGISWGHISQSNGGQEAHRNSHPRRDFMGARHPIKRRPGGTQQLTVWRGFHGGMSANQTEARRHTATHTLEGGKSANQTEAWRHTATHKLDEISWAQVS